MTNGTEPMIVSYLTLRRVVGFLGVLLPIAWFMFTYHGHDNRDNLAGYLAWLFALGVALFPASGSAREKAVHFASATGLFLVLSYFSLRLFTLSGATQTPQKLKRNRVYRTCVRAAECSRTSVPRSPRRWRRAWAGSFCSAARVSPSARSHGRCAAKRSGDCSSGPTWSAGQGSNSAVSPSCRRRRRS